MINSACSPDREVVPTIGKPPVIITDPNEIVAIEKILEYPAFQREKWLLHHSTFINLLWGYSDLGWTTVDQGLPAALKRLKLFPEDTLVLFSICNLEQIQKIIPAITPLLTLQNVIYSDRLANIDVLRELYSEAQQRCQSVSLTEVLTQSLQLFYQSVRDREEMCLRKKLMQEKNHQEAIRARVQMMLDLQLND